MKFVTTSVIAFGISCAGVGLLSVFATASANAESVAETVWIPMKEVDAAGERTIRLEATLYKPAGAGPFPLVMFNHGSSGGPIPPEYAEKAKALGAFLVEKGVSLIVPMRRGRGKSEGENQEEPSPCTLEAAKQGVKYASAAVDATYEYLRLQPWVSMNKVVLAGHSRGGILAVAYAADHPGSTIGVINFSGGWKSDKCGPTDLNLELFAEAAGKSKVPNLFLYGRGDAFYSDDSVNNYAETFKRRGGDVEFKLFEVEKINGHQLFHRALALWRGSVDGFLVRINMPLAVAKE